MQLDKLKVSAPSVLRMIPDDLLAKIASDTKVDYCAKVLKGERLFYLLVYAFLCADRLSQRKLETVFSSQQFKSLFNYSVDMKVSRSSISTRLSAINLDFFEQRGIGIINASPLAMGLLSQRGVPSWHPAPQPLVEACHRAAEYCSQKGYPIEKLAVQFSLSNERIVSTLFSSANPANVRQNILWANEELDWDLVREVKEIIGNQQRVTWANS